MKILIISNHEIFYNARLLKAADYFAGKGAEVYVFNPITGFTTREIYDNLKKGKSWIFKESDISKRDLASKCRWLYVSILNKIIYEGWKKFRWSFQFDKVFNKGLISNSIDKGIKYDYILINLVDNLPYAAKVKKATGAKIIYDSQEHFVGQYKKYPVEQKDWVVKAEKDFINEVDILLATTNVMKSRLVNDYSLQIPSFRVRNIPSKLMLNSNTKPSDKSKKSYLVWHGMGIYLNNTRGVHILVQAIAKCKTDVVLILQGKINAEQKKILDGYIDELNLEGKIQVLPPADPYNIVESLRSYDIGLIGELPEEDNQLLTSSNKLFDYINAGLAVIASDLPGLNETVKELNIGVTYSPGDIDALANAIDGLVNAPETLAVFKRQSDKVSKEELYWEFDYEPVWKVMSN